MPQSMYLTQEGMEKLKGELERLLAVRRQEVAERIQEARERGGTVANAEYEEAKNELAFTEGRILTLDNIINNAVIIEKHDRPAHVDVGSTVTVVNQKGHTYEYTITGSAEADPTQGKISNVSPIGKALLGKKVKNAVEVNVPAGKIRLEILAVE